MRRALLLAASAALLSTTPEPADAAGRRPYGGALTLPARDVSGVLDPHRASDPGQRLQASLAHCRLFRRAPGGAPVPELARDAGRWSGRTLTLAVRDGATFHSGAPITAADVARSLTRLGQPRVGAPLRAAFAAMAFEAVDPTTLRVTAPPGAPRDAVLHLLSRDEAAVLRDGRPGAGRGCGPYAPGASDARGLTLEAFAGHPLGRPFVDRVQLRLAPRPTDEVEAFVFGDLDLSLLTSPRYRKARRAAAGPRATVFAVMHPRHRGAEGRDLRRAIAKLAADARLQRHVDWRAEPASGPWPAALAPGDRAMAPPTAVPSLPSLTVAYPAGDAALEELGRALRDTLGPLAVTSSGVRTRAIGVPGLTRDGAVQARAPEWDLALVVHPWTATAPWEAALEAAEAFAIPGLTPAAAMTTSPAGKTRDWARTVATDALLVPILHLALPLHARADLGLALPEAPTGLPELPDAFTPPAGR